MDEMVNEKFKKQFLKQYKNRF